MRVISCRHNHDVRINIIQLLHTFLDNSENYRPLGAVDNLMHYRPRPQCPKRFVIVVLLPNHFFNRRDSSSGRASASCAVGQVRCRIDTWPRHTKDVIKMVPVATLLGAQHYKASTGFSSLSQTMQH